tara:strand:+ start:85 stop:867 length:783 start_codon:yes stop_codon:yes gene_type:complete
MIDPYGTLGVSKNATDSEIKSAYRRLAKQHHPDAGGNENKFANVSNAYNMIKDAEHRQNFENEKLGPSNFQQSQHPFRQHFGDFNDIFNQMFSQNVQKSKPQTHLAFNVSVEDVFNGATKNVNVSIHNSSKPISITIPKGIKSGDEVLYQNMAPNGGDLVVKFIINEDKNCYTQGHNIVRTLSIGIVEAMIGTEKVITTLDNKQFKLHISSGTQSGTKLRIPESGLPRKSQPNGDLILEVKVKIPKLNNNDLDKKLRDML